MKKEKNDFILYRDQAGGPLTEFQKYLLSKLKEIEKEYEDSKLFTPYIWFNHGYLAALQDLDKKEK